MHDRTLRDRQVFTARVWHAAFLRDLRRAVCLHGAFTAMILLIAVAFYLPSYLLLAALGSVDVFAAERKANKFDCFKFPSYIDLIHTDDAKVSDAADLDYR